MPMRPFNRTAAVIAGVALLVALVAYLLAGLGIGFPTHDAQLQLTSAHAAQTPGSEPPNTRIEAVSPPASNSVELTQDQLKSVSVEPVSEQIFRIEREAVGKIAFNDERSVQVFTPYQGRIIEVYARAGDAVKKGQLLFTVDSPDLVQAEQTLISTAGQL